MSQLSAVREELARLDAHVADLKSQISTVEMEQKELQQKVDKLVSDRKPLEEERQKLAAVAPSNLPPAKRARGRPPKTRDPTPTSASPESSPKPAQAIKPPPKKAKASGNGSTPSGGIYVPSETEAMDACGDESLYCPVFLFPERRKALLSKHIAAPCANPGELGAKRLQYLASRDPSRASGYDGFIMFEEEWGRRNAYSVTLAQLSYPKGKLEVANALLAAMQSRLDPSKSGTITAGTDPRVRRRPRVRSARVPLHTA